MTLIELLLVVAVLALLALIAVPNFLEATLRAKRARADTDLRTIAVALELYYLDYNDYPPRSDEAITVPGYRGGYLGLFRLTTPVAYLTSIPYSPFITERLGPGKPGPITYELATTGCSPRTVKGWAVYSCGPDLSDDTGPGIPEYPYETMVTTAYDPTNGSVSIGDIHRFGPHQFPGKVLWK